MEINVDSNEDAKPIGYHLNSIPKGEIGKSSKIYEEVLEFLDAEQQNCKIMELVELSDLYGAIELYLEHNYIDVGMDDLKNMSNITRRVFKNGGR